MILRRALSLGLLSLWGRAALAAAGPPAPATLPIAPVTPAAPTAPSPLDVALESLRLQEALRREVPHLVARTPETDAAWIALAQTEAASAGLVLDRPQVLVVVDRSPRVQQLALLVAAPRDAAHDAPRDDWRVLGGTKVSTGSMGRFDHYVTPRGVFHVTSAILGFRAEGTVNENGIRGLGAKGMRVWDFGWQVAMKGWDAGPGKPDRIPIRLMMHATDPDKLEQRIGRPASQGCVRIPSAMNRFLDNHGLLDVEYERAAVTDIRFRALLPPARQPSPLAGNTMVVVETPDKPSLKVAGVKS